MYNNLTLYDAILLLRSCGVTYLSPAKYCYYYYRYRRRCVGRRPRGAQTTRSEFARVDHTGSAPLPPRADRAAYMRTSGRIRSRK